MPMPLSPITPSEGGERDLADDAKWKQIQKNTFTRWCNQHLAKVNKFIYQLDTDLSDGILLCQLVEVLAQRPVGKYNKKPTFRSQQLENVSVALKFLEQDEHIKIVNIDSSHIVDHHLKLILGLVWTLILHYAISGNIPQWEDEEENGGGVKESGKQRLMKWINAKLPDIGVRNFTTDWNDGRALGALVDSVAPGLCPDWKKWDPNEKLENTTEAMVLADKWLNVGQLLEPSELIDPNIDDRSVMTYLAQYPSAKLNEGAPLRGPIDPSKIRAYGPGVAKSGLMASVPTQFTVETFGAGKGKVEVMVKNPIGKMESVQVGAKDDRAMSYNVSYTPLMDGLHTVVVNFAGQNIPGSPFSVEVEPVPVDVSKVRCVGQGLESGVVVGKSTFFEIFTKGAGPGNPDVVIVDPNGGKDIVRPVVRQIDDDAFRCDYVAQEIGLHSINVFYANLPLANSPYGVTVSPDKPRRLSSIEQPVSTVAAGASLRRPSSGSSGGRSGSGSPRPRSAHSPGHETEAIVIPRQVSSTASARPVSQPPTRSSTESSLPSSDSPESAYRRNSAHSPGFPKEPVVAPEEFVAVASMQPAPPVESPPMSPTIVSAPTANYPEITIDPSRCRAWGRGVQKNGVRVGDRADFKVYTKDAGQGDVSVVVTSGGRRIPVDHRPLDDTTDYYVYEPKVPGSYDVAVTYGEQHIPKSPFEVNVLPEKQTKVRAFGPGLEGGVANLPCDFTVETNKESGGLGFSIEGPSKAQIDCKDNGDGSAEVSYMPTVPGDYAIHVMCNNEDIPESPYMVEIGPFQMYRPSQVRCYGEGIESRRGLKCGKQTEFVVETRYAGDATLKVWGLDQTYTPMDIKVYDNGDSTYTCTYTPKEPIKHTIMVSYGGVAVAGCPYRIYPEEPIDPSKVRVFGPGIEGGVKSQTPTHFVVDCKQAGPGTLEVELKDEKGAPVEMDLLDNTDGSFTVKYTAPRPGPYQVRVVFAGTEIPGSPIRVSVQPHLDVSGIRVEGLDSRVFVDSPSEFTVDARALTKTGGPNTLSAELLPPGYTTGEVMRVVDNYNGTYLVQYIPHEAGTHHIEVRYDNVQIPQFPLAVIAEHGFDSRRCRAVGPGLERGYVNMNSEFTVETKGAGVGSLGVQIEGPSEAQIDTIDNKDGSCTVRYRPLEPGEYAIAIKFGKQHIPGSPFKVPVDFPVNAGVVSASGPGLESKNCRAGVPLSFHVDASRSGYAPLDIGVTSDKGVSARLPEIKERPNNHYDVTYYATAEGSLCSVNVTYGDKPVQKSPFRLRVLPTFEPNKVRLSGAALTARGEIPASLPLEFKVDTAEAGYANLEVLVTNPEGETIPVKVVDKEDGTYEVIVIPEDIGEYKIQVKYGGDEVPRSPISLRAYQVGDASKCFIVEGLREEAQINEEYCITVNKAKAGRGNLTCRIKPQTRSAKPMMVDVDSNNDGTDTAYYTLQQPDQYDVFVKYGGVLIPKGQFTIWADTAEKIPKPKFAGVLNSALINGASAAPPTFYQNFQPEDPNFDIKDITGDVIMPSTQHDKPVVKENHDGSVTVKYQPHEKGMHELLIKHKGAHVPGSPFQFHVDDVRGGYVTAFGPGLSYGGAGEAAHFTICAQDAGAGESVCGPGGLTVNIEGPAKADIKCLDNKDGTCAVSWTPPAPGEYKIHVKFADKEIHGSPFAARIAGEGRKRAHLSVGSTSEVSLNIAEPDIKGLSASIKSPSGIEEPCFIRKLDTKSVGISFTPREVGEHLVTVKKKATGALLPKAPFRILVSENDVGNADKVKVSGAGVESAETQKPNEFTVDTRGAGFGGLTISVEGPSKCEMQCKDNQDGTCKIIYQPTEPGIYVINVKFADHHVQNSPFTVACRGVGVGNVTENLKQQRHLVPFKHAGDDCELCLKLPGTNPFDMAAKVLGPDGVSQDAEICDVGDSQYVVRFKPKEQGRYTISVMHKDLHISGSPFSYTVGDFKEGGAHKVRAGGSGLVQAEVNHRSSFNIYTREAGAGNLTVAVEGPSKAEIDFKDHRDGNCYVSYACTKSGNYNVAIKFDDKHIPDSPFKVFVAPSTGEARKMSLAAFPDIGHKLNTPITFSVLLNGAQGQLDAKVVTPSAMEEDCFVSPIDDDTYSVRFVPKEAGNHYVHIKLDGTHMQDSPFRLRVGGREQVDPTAITVSGNGLKTVETGQKCEFIINTCNAGAGTLQVTLDGPSKVTLDAYEVDVGYKVRYTPLAPGDYFATIKFNGVHIPGSPHKIVATGQQMGGAGINESAQLSISAAAKSSKGGMSDDMPTYKGDGELVECRGMGLKRVKVGQQNMFTIDTAKAGPNLLYVAVMNLKGPVDDVIIKHMGRGQYTINYITRERGRVFIFVKYGDKPVVGSPFTVDV